MFRSWHTLFQHFPILKISSNCPYQSNRKICNYKRNGHCQTKSKIISFLKRSFCNNCKILLVASYRKFSKFTKLEQLIKWHCNACPSSIISSTTRTSCNIRHNMSKPISNSTKYLSYKIASLQFECICCNCN